jgi:nitrogen fixation protein FixH
MKKGSLWPWMIGAALAVQVVSSLVVVAVATRDASYAVEEDYYQKAIDWDSKRAQDRANAELGWALDYDLSAPSLPGERPQLEVRLRDRDGAPIDGAAVELEAFPNIDSGSIIRLQLADSGEGGTYSAGPDMRRDGLWEMRFTVTRGADTFTYRETRHLYVEGSWK